MNASSAPSEARFHLDVCRGRTRSPSRPVDGETFLVGSGENCHLRLGDDAVPALHSALRVVGEFVQIVPIEAAPLLRVNGIPVQDESFLEHGDVIEIAGFEFVLRDSATAVGEPDVTELDAAELVDQLERDLELVEEDELSRRAGAESLFEAVREHHVQTEAEQMARRLEEFTTEFDRRSLQLADREHWLTTAMGELLEAQRMLEERLALLGQRLDEGTDESRRAA